MAKKIREVLKSKPNQKPSNKYLPGTKITFKKKGVKVKGPKLEEGHYDLR